MKKSIKKNKVAGTLSRVPTTKNNKGISLITLIITIIVLIILAAISLAGFNETTERATSSKILNDFIEVENAVSILGKMHKMDASVHPYEGAELSNENSITINDKEYGDGYYYLNKEALEKIGVTSTNKEYIVSYVTGEVIVTDPYLVNQRKIYTKVDLINEETNNSVTGLAEYDEEKGVNKPVLYHGMLPVKYENNEWVVCDVNDREWYDYAITGTGPVRTANAMLMDDITLIPPSGGSSMSNETVRSTPIEKLVGYTVETPGSMFVWIPRYSYKEVGGKNQIIYSYLTQDYLLNGYIKSPAFYNGEYRGATESNDNAGYIASGTELTGIWISKYQAAYVDD